MKKRILIIKNRKSPGDLLNIAIVGVAGRGKWNIKGVSSENIVAICDVDRGDRSIPLKRYGW